MACQRRFSARKHDQKVKDRNEVEDQEAGCFLDAGIMREERCNTGENSQPDDCARPARGFTRRTKGRKECSLFNRSEREYGSGAGLIHRKLELQW
jgi:hypothetical protein